MRTDPDVAGRGRRLPDRLQRWAPQRRESPPQPLTVESADARLHVRLAPGPGNAPVLLLRKERKPDAGDFGALGLTRREQQILLWISEGKSNPEIGRILGMNVRTVHKHVEHLLAKLGVENRAGAMLKALSLLNRGG